MKLEQAIGFKKGVRHFAPDNSLPLPLELMGVELEYEGIPRNRDYAPTYWSAVPDGSLRNDGLEYIFTEPLYGVGITEALDNMQEYVEHINPAVTERCSVHVHMNVSDMDVDQLLTLVVLYLIFEKAIVAYHGGMREHNIFCVPYYKAPDALQALVYLFTHPDEMESGEVRHTLSNFNKYYGLNLGAVIQHGSLEFRHMGGCTSMAKVKEWISVIQHLKRTALNTGTDYMELINNMSGNTSFITSEVFGTMAEVLEPYVTVNDLMAGARLAQRIVQGDHLNKSNDKERRRRTNKATIDKMELVRKRVGSDAVKKKSADVDSVMHRGVPLGGTVRDGSELSWSNPFNMSVTEMQDLEERFRVYVETRDNIAEESE